MVEASYYDGQTARRHAVTLSLDSAGLHVRGEAVNRDVLFSAIVISEKLGSAPRQLHFSDGAYCVVTDQAGLERMLTDAGYAPHSLVSRFEAGWHYALLALVIMLGFSAAAYQWGLPWFAQKVAENIPVHVAQKIDTHALQTFDQWLLKPSKLSPARQQALAARFEALKLPEGQALPPHGLVFRSSPAIGPNAFALPGGTIVLLDELVTLADKDQDHDDEIIGVLSHELGHASERHALRQLLQGSIVAVAMTWYLGDVSSLLASAPTALLQTRYSRDFERQADNYAIQVLKFNGISPLHLANMLAKLEAAQDMKRKSQGKDKSPEIGEYFSTHPETSERIRTLRGAS